MSVVHPQKTQLIAFGQGKLAAEESSQVEQHLELCRECCETLLDLKDDTFVGLVRIAKSHESDRRMDTLVRPESLSDKTESDKAGTGKSSHPTDAVTVLVQSGETADADELPAELREHPRYRIVELIGRGGMGNVYRAEHRLMNRAVAIKLINSQLMQHPHAVERFRREVQAAAKLSHPNIVAAYDAEQAGSAHFLVMEFVEGTDLASVVKHRGPMSVAEACDCIRQAAVGLQHAHEKGMVHRDIKPHNLMLAAGGQVRILDFGLAGFAETSFESSPVAPRQESRTSDDADSHNQPSDTDPAATRNRLSCRGATGLHLTTAGSVMGTPDYIAPEQVQDAHSADIRADIYSLGCTLHFLLTGQPPFEADNVLAKLKAHAEASPPVLTTLRNDVPAKLANVVARMMAKNPAERFQTPAEVAAALASFSQPAVAPPRKRTLRRILAAAAVILLAGVIYITTDKGRIEIHNEVDDVDVVVSHGGKEVKTIDLATGSQVTWVPSGDYTVSLKQDRNDILITPQGFTLSRWGKQIVSLTLKGQKDLPNLPGGAMSETVTPGFNGSFEVTKSGLPVSWSFYTRRTVPTGDFDIVTDTTDFKEGEQSLKFVVRKCESTGGRLSPGFFNEFRIANFNPPAAFETKPGETYKISFWAKNAGSEFVFKARGVSALDGDKGVVIRSKETINKWRRFECTYTIPPKMWLRLELNVVQPGMFWIDDLQIVKVNIKAETQVARPLAPPPSPEINLGTNLVVDSSFEKTAVGQPYPLGWGTGNISPPNSFKHQVAEGGRTGQRGWLIEGNGQFAVVPSNRPAAHPAYHYAASAWVRVESGSAQIKLLYFDGKGQYIGENRGNVSIQQGEWHKLTMVDDLKSYPEARSLSLAMTMVGTGKAVFDDLEVLAFDATKLPEKFEATYGASAHYADVFDRWVGEWEAERTGLVGRPVEQFSPATQTSRKVLSDRFLLTHTADKSGAGLSLWVLAYDANFTAYRWWDFGRSSKPLERRGQWDAAAQTLVLQRHPRTFEATNEADFAYRFIGNERIETTWVSPAGQVQNEHVIQTAQKKTPQPATLSEIPSVAGPATEPEELSLLNKFAGEWTIHSKSKPSIWLPNGSEETQIEKVAWILGGRFLMARTFNEKDELTSIWLSTYEPSEKSNRFWFFNADGSSGQWRVTWDAASRGFHWRSIDMPAGWIGTGFNRWVNDSTFDNQALIKDENGRVLLDSTQDKRRKK